VKRLTPGTYRLSIIATNMLGFQLVGPRLKRHTPVALWETAPYKVTNTTWKIRLRRGTYSYGLIGRWASGLHAARGSFQVR
jgi:hypothetical protein